MKRILYLTNMGKQLNHLKKIIPQESGKSDYLGDIQDSLEVRIERLKNDVDMPFDVAWKEKLASFDCVILTHMGTGLDTPFLQKLANWMYRCHPCYLIFAEEKDKDKLHKGITNENIQKIETYISYSGVENYTNLLRYTGSLLDPMITYEEPKSLPWHGIIDGQGTYYSSYGEYHQAYVEQHGTPKSALKIGLLFYREEWIANELDYQQAFFEAISDMGAEPIIFFAQYGANERVGSPALRGSMEAIFGHHQVPFDVLINTCKFSLFGLQAMELDILKAFNIPILQGYNIYLDEAAWNASIEGLTPMEVSLSVSLPEFDGSIHGGVTAAQTRIEDGSYVYLPIAERVEAVTKRAVKWARLRHRNNADKKVAIIFHNYPPTNSNIGSACGMDSPESVRLILQAMQEDGYTIDTIPEDSKAFMDQVLAHSTNDRRFLTEEQIAAAEGKLTSMQYGQFFESLSPKAQAHLIDGWGNAPGEVFNYDDELLIPGFQNGNVWITVQPPRGFGEDPSKIYHDPVCAPTHHYEGFYYWLRDIWQADAVVHVGTHGSLEWLPGKGTGLGPDCYPEMAIQDLPNVYPYWTTIVGEGIQAKRRGAACLIGHLTPPMDHSGLYDQYEELEQLLDEHTHFEQNRPDQLSEIETMIVEKAKECHIYEDIKDVETMSFADLMGELHTRLTDLKHMQMRCGLHILGKVPTDKHLREFLSGLVRVQNNANPSLPALLAEAIGEDFQELQNHSGQAINKGRYKGQRKGEVVDHIWQGIDQLMDGLEANEYRYFTEWKALPILADLLEEANSELVVQINHLIHIICEEYVVNLRQTTAELANTVRALDGEYIEPGPGGAPTGGRADVLPTGRNFYGVDERLLPTKAAYALGTKLADQVIASFIADEGHYPEQVGIVLWAGSNTRSHGQCVAQFLNLMGVRPIWQGSSGRVIGLEAIPLSELKRPRIDVTGRISGLIRDMMPNALKWLDKAVLMVSELDESPDDNYIIKHVGEDVSWLVEEGEDKDDAYVKARWRIFGDPPGAYGAGIGYVLESKNWESIDDLAEIYTKWGGHSYSTDRQVGDDDRLFKRRLATMEVTIKNEDNREVSMLSSDDYNAYHGGMIAAVRSLRGKAPKSYVGDSSDKENLKTRTLQEEIKRLFRGEASNPKFIEGMMQHGYKGAADMASYVAHSYQWDATSAVMEDWMYEEYAQKYAFDPKVQDWMKAVNPWALQRISEVLLEAIQRGLWNASDEMKEELQTLYLTMEGNLEERSE